MTSDTAFLLLEMDKRGEVKATGQSSYWRSRTQDSTHVLSPLDRLKVSGAAAWHWDGTQLLARTSDTGWLPLYYTHHDNRFVISSSLLYLRERFTSDALDWPALALLLALGHFIDGDTPFRDIRVLPIRSTLSWRQGTLAVEERSFDAPPLDITYEDATARYRAELSAAIERSKPRDGFVLGLSGGRDSRHILLELLDRGVLPGRLITSAHYLPTSDADIAAAVALADRVGHPLTLVDADQDRIRAEIWKNNIGEFQTLGHSWSRRLAAQVSPSDTLYDGMEPAALFGRSGPVRRLRSIFGEELEPISEVVAVWTEYSFDEPIVRVQNLFNERPFTNADLSRARQRLTDSIMKYSTTPNPAQAFRYYNHTSRDSAVFAYRFMPAQRVLTPFDDPSMVRFGLGLPWSVSSNPNLQSEAIREGYPSYADVPFYWELTNKPRIRQHDADLERASASHLIQTYPEDLLPPLDPAIRSTLALGKAPLYAVQMVTYLSQLLSWNTVPGFTPPDHWTHRL